MPSGNFRARRILKCELVREISIDDRVTLNELVRAGAEIDSDGLMRTNLETYLAKIDVFRRLAIHEGFGWNSASEFAF